MTIYRDQLEAVYELIELPDRWTTDWYARNEVDEWIDQDYLAADGVEYSDANIATHRDAVCWCLYGAAYKCGIYNDAQYVAALGFNQTYQVADFNDTHTHAEVLALLRAAIKRAPARPTSVTSPTSEAKS